MNLTTLGDLSRTFSFRQREADLKFGMQKAQTELTTGHAADTRQHLRGDYAHLADIERSLSVLGSYRTAILESEVMTSAMHAALSSMQNVSSDLASGLLFAAQSGSEQGLDTVSADAQNAFASIVSQLNTQAGNRGLFSGAAFDVSALVSSEAILTELRVAIAGATTLTGVQAALDDWFDTPGGNFESIAFQGVAQDGTPLQLSEDVRIGISIRADDQVFRDLMKTAAIAGLAADESLGFSLDLKHSMIQSAGRNLIELQAPLTGMIAGLGAVQSQIEDSSVRNEASSTALAISRNALLGVDQYEAATRLEQAQSQIEMLYAVTVRASRLTLLDYMR